MFALEREIRVKETFFLSFFFFFLFFFFATSRYNLHNIKMQPTCQQVAGLTLKDNCYLRCSVRCQDTGPQATASPFLNPDSNSNPQPENKRCYCQLLPPTCSATSQCTKKLRTSVWRKKKASITILNGKKRNRK